MGSAEPAADPIVIDALDPAARAEFWAQVFGWPRGRDRCFPPDDWLRMEGGALIAFDRKIRDGFPGDAFALGASPEDPNTGHRGMFDPEGNEFCLH